MGESTVWKILKHHFLNQWCVLIWSTDPVISQRATASLEKVRKNVVRMIKCSENLRLKKKKKKGKVVRD